MLTILSVKKKLLNEKNLQKFSQKWTFEPTLYMLHNIRPVKKCACAYICTQLLLNIGQKTAMIPSQISFQKMLHGNTG